MSRIRANQITNQSADGAPTVQNGLIISGVCTATSFVGSGANLTSLPSQVTITGNSDNRVITGGSGTNLVGEQRLTYSGSELTNANVTSNEDSAINIYKATGDNADKAILRVGYNETNSFKLWRPRADGNIYMETSQSSSDIIINTNNGSAIGERLRIASDGKIGIGVASPTRTIDTHVTDSGANYFHLTNSGTGTGDSNGIFIGLDAAEGAIIWNQENNYVRFGTNNLERLRITSDGDVAIGRDTALNNYAAGSTTTQLAVVKDGGAAGSGYHEVAHFTGGTDTNDTGAIVRITQFNNDRGLYIKGGRGTGDQAKAIFGLRNSANSDSDVMVFHQGGNVTKPSEVGFHATGNNTYTHSSSFVPEFNVEYFDIGGGYNNSNYRFTAPVAGRYFIYFQYLTYPDADPAYKTFLLRKNGSSSGLYDQGFYRGREGMQGNQTSQQMSTYIQLAENDYIEPYVEMSGSNFKNYMSSGHAHFWGFLVH